MGEWIISDKEIESVEKLLLPDGACFSEDAKAVIRCWHSIDVSACPGSGKTTVLLAKLKLLADRMPLDKGAGICVLSHTNVAVNEIRTRLSDYADQLCGYPNYIGTIQSFIDKFVTIPYLRNKAGKNVIPIDDNTYAKHMKFLITNNVKYSKLKYFINNKIRDSRYNDSTEYLEDLYLRDDGALCIKRQEKPIASKNADSAKQFKNLREYLLVNEGIIRFSDAYLYAKNAIEELPENYTDLFSKRFQYIFVDEYQDCNRVQRNVIDALFKADKCILMKIGDPDQAIYNSLDDETGDWIPNEGYLSITCSSRYNQEIANIICRLKKDRSDINTLAGMTGVKPIAIVFDDASIDKVIETFIDAMEENAIIDGNGIYKAIGFIKNSRGLTISSYWKEFEGDVKRQNENSYWNIIEDVCNKLSDGQLYIVERTIRKLICRIFHYANISNPNSGKEFTVVSLKKYINEKFGYTYRDWLYAVSQIKIISRESVDIKIRELIKELCNTIGDKEYDPFACVPSYFLDNTGFIKQTIDKSEKNIYFDPLRGCKIIFDTIHGVKGETHDATLYLETETRNASDIKRILPYLGVGKIEKSQLYEYSRKIAYVGMSRPRKLLCVAMQSETFEQCCEIMNSEWEIRDLRRKQKLLQLKLNC